MVIYIIDVLTSSWGHTFRSWHDDTMYISAKRYVVYGILYILAYFI